jgi:hypothetical protein
VAVKWLIDKQEQVVQEKGFYVYNMHIIVEKNFSISMAPVRSRGGSLVYFVKEVLCGVRDRTKEKHRSLPSMDVMASGCQGA